jgi:hypothetical protein
MKNAYIILGGKPEGKRNSPKWQTDMKLLLNN